MPSSIRRHMPDLQIPRRRLHSTYADWFPSFLLQKTLTRSIVIGKCGHSFHMVFFTSFYHSKNTGADHIFVQHCILTWIQQDSAKGQCPMCRQSKQAFENKRIYFLIQSRVRVETRRRMKKAEHYRFCIASAHEAWVGWGIIFVRDTLTTETNTGVSLLQSSRYVDCISRTTLSKESPVSPGFQSQ